MHTIRHRLQHYAVENQTPPGKPQESPKDTRRDLPQGQKAPQGSSEPEQQWQQPKKARGLQTQARAESHRNDRLPLSNRFKPLQAGTLHTTDQEGTKRQTTEGNLLGFTRAQDLCTVKDAGKKVEEEQEEQSDGVDGSSMYVEEGKTKEVAEVQQVAINRLKAGFSEEELTFFREAIDQGRTSRTHFTDPGAAYFYRCPICNRVINSENLSRSVKMHFAMMRKTQKTYHITINHKSSNMQTIKPYTAGKAREGGKPPPKEFIEDRCRELPLEETHKKNPTKTQGKKAPRN